MKRCLKWLTNILIALVLFTLAFFFLAPQLGGVHLFSISSGSMSPMIPVASVVVVKPVAAADIGVGDVITFNTSSIEEKAVTHRVVEVIDEDGSLSFRTAGDANGSPDGTTVSANNVIGKVWFHVPYLGYLSSFVQTKLGFIWVVIVPSFCIILLEIRSVIREIRLSKKPLEWQPASLAMEADFFGDDLYQDINSRDFYTVNDRIQMTDAALNISPQDNVSAGRIDLMERLSPEPMLTLDDIRIEDVQPIALDTELTNEPTVALKPVERADESKNGDGNDNDR